MKRNFTHENFEDFLRQSADGLRMRPSGKVWKGVSNHLNKRRRRFGFVIASFLLALSTTGYLLMNDNSGQIPSSVNQSSANEAKAIKAVEKQPAQQIHETQTSSLGPTPQSASENLKNSANTTSFLLQLPGNNTTDGSVDKTALSSLNNEFIPTIVDSYFDNTTSEESTKQNVTDKSNTSLPLTIESIVNSYQPLHLKKKLSWQFYFTPTVSYRKLGENKSFLRDQSTSSPNYAPALIYDVNNVVTHKPDVGFELGMAAKYPLTKNLTLRGGMQFNVNRYDIKAYTATTSVATIMFNGRRNNSADSLNAVTRYSNVPGYRTSWLQNFYFQISAPVGVELKISGNDKVQFGVATTIQPTYVLGDRAYLISTNYKNYAEVPQLVRRWNVNTALETFVGYSTGRLNWQVGPQVRYQLLSSFVNKYPVKENLFDFGLKVGVSVNNHQ